MTAIRPDLVAPALLALLLGLPFREARAQAPGADSIQAQRERAEALFKEDRYLEAVQVLEQAYTQRGSPGLLYLLGRAHERLGQAREARTHYQRYLAAEPSPDPKILAEVRQSLQRLQALEPSAQPVRPTATQLLGQLRVKPAPVAAMIGSGVVSFVAGCGMVAPGGYLLYRSMQPTPPCKPGAILCGLGESIDRVLGPILTTFGIVHVLSAAVLIGVGAAKNVTRPARFAVAPSVSAGRLGVTVAFAF